MLPVGNSGAHFNIFANNRLGAIAYPRTPLLSCRYSGAQLNVRR